MSDDGIQTAPIACETCRRKKCKCDRKLPSCSQCRSSPEGCLYPEKNRRGIPAGYVNALEKRLAETERALFFALHELHDGEAVHADYQNQPPFKALRESVLSSDTSSTQQEKANLVASWASRPLENRTQARTWLESMRTEAYATDNVHPQGVAQVSLISNAAPSMVPGKPESERVEDSESNGNALPGESQQRKTSRRRGKRLRGRASRLSEPYRSQRNGGAADPPNLAPPSSRASSFAKANKAIYF